MRYYIYKIIFEDGCTYIGCHYEKKPNDGYITSSSYFRKNKHLKYKREELITVKDRETCGIMETLCIMSDKCENDKNVNYNLGNWYHSSYCSAEHRKKISEATKRNWTYERKKKQSERMSGENNPMYGKSRIGETHKKFSNEGKENISNGIKSFYKTSKGRETAQKISERKKNCIWINNGEITRLLLPNEEIPQGWKKGKLFSKEALERLKKNGSRQKEPHIYITNGYMCKAIEPNEPIPIGWKRGRKTNGFSNTKTD